MIILKLGQIDKEYLKLVGGKARGLDELIKMAYKVPCGFVLTDIDIDNDLPKAIEFYKQTGFETVAVRSSASVEDGADFSYAGQFSSFLNIKDEQAFEEALKKCVLSLENEEAKKYNAAIGGNKKNTMSVVVQQMIQADCAGVCFTSEPNNSKNILIEAIKGDCEALVSGKATACQYIVDKNEIDLLEDIKPPLSKEIIQKICYAAKDLEKKFNAPLDLEWCIKDNEIFWLQQRPITTTATTECTIDEFNPKENLDGHAITRYNISEMLPGAVTPLTLCTTIFSIDWGIRKMLKIAGANKKMKLLPPFSCVFSTKGHLFMNLSTVYRLTRSTYLAKVSNVDLSICDRELKDDETGIVPGKNSWFLPRLINSFKYIKFIMSAKKAKKKIAKLADNFIIDENETSIKSLYTKLSKAQNTANEAAYLHYITSGQSGAMSSATTGKLDKKFNNREKSRAVLSQMLEKIDDIESVDILLSLRKIASAIIKENENARDYSTDELSDYLESASNEIKELYDSFMKRHGHRAIREAELRSLGWADDKESFLRYLKTVLSGNLNELKSQAPPDLKQIAKDNGFKKHKMLVYFAKQARAGVKNREYSKAKLIKIYDVIKKGYARLAKMLVAENRLPDTDAIYFLTHNELGELIENENATLIKKAIQRKRLFKTQSALKFAEIYTKLPAPILAQKAVSGQVLKGTPVSRGISTGPARIVKTTEDALELKLGEIMVAEFTDIGWSPFYCKIDGLVTEVGSALSHGGVVAREYALPLVSNVSNATTTIKTGDIITIDGETGTVSIN